MAEAFGALSDSEKNQAALDSACIGHLVKRSYIESADVLLSTVYLKPEMVKEDVKILSDSRTVFLSAVESVRAGQDELLSLFDEIQNKIHFKDSIPVISPALRWGQSGNSTFMEVKFSTRFDSPACLDIFDLSVELGANNRDLSISAMCRNDKKLLNYKLETALNGEVHPFDLDGELEKQHSIDR